MARSALPLDRQQRMVAVLALVLVAVLIFQFVVPKLGSDDELVARPTVDAPDPDPAPDPGGVDPAGNVPGEVTDSMARFPERPRRVNPFVSPIAG